MGHHSDAASRQPIGSSAAGHNFGIGRQGARNIRHPGDITARNLQDRFPRFESVVGVRTSCDITVGICDACSARGSSYRPAKYCEHVEAVPC